MQTTRIIRTREEYAAVEPAWARLHAAQAERPPFLGWTWFDCFWATMPRAGGDPAIVTAWDGADLVGAAPMRFGHARFGGISCPVASGLENAHSPGFRWLLPPDDARAGEVAQRLCNAIAALVGKRHVITWDNAPGEQSRALARHLAGDYRVAVRPARSRRVLLVPGGVEPYLETLSANMRRRLTRGWSRLGGWGAVRFEEVARSHDLGAHLRAAWDLEAMGWKGQSGGAVSLDPAVRSFYDGLAVRSAPRGELALFMLWCDDQLAAFLYGLVHDGALYALKFSYHPRFSAASPGYLVIWKAIEWAGHNGIATVDLGRDSDHKAHWGGERRAAGRFYAFRRGIQGTFMCAAHVGWKALARRLMPGRTAESTPPWVAGVPLIVGVRMRYNEWHFVRAGRPSSRVAAIRPRIRLRTLRRPRFHPQAKESRCRFW